MFNTLNEKTQSLITSLKSRCVTGHNIQPIEDFQKDKISLNEMIAMIENNVQSRIEKRPLSAWQKEHYAEYTLNALQTLKEI